MTSVVDKVRRRNPVRFYKELKAYELDLAVQGQDPALQELRQRGICILPAYVPAPDVAAIRAEVEHPLRVLRAAGQGDDEWCTAYPQAGTYVLHRVEERFTACRRFVEDRRIRELVEGYSRGRGTSFSAIAELRAEPRRNELVDDWHTDTWLFRFKAMLYLSEVGPDNAPLRYLAGSHTGQNWRWSKFVSAYAAHSVPGARLSHGLRARAAAAQAHKSTFDPLTCVGPAGTVILFDTRGVHGGTTLREGERLLLNHTFVARQG